MFDVSAKEAIGLLVTNMVPVGSEHGLHVVCHLTMYNPDMAGTDENGEKLDKLVPRNAKTDADTCSANAVRLVHFLFSRPTSFTKVWSYTGKFKMPAADEWKMTAWHDSCWRDDGFSSFRDAYSAMLNEVTIDGEDTGRLHPSCSVVLVETVKIHDDIVMNDHVARCRVLGTGPFVGKIALV